MRLPVLPRSPLWFARAQARAHLKRTTLIGACRPACTPQACTGPVCGRSCALSILAHQCCATSRSPAASGVCTAGCQLQPTAPNRAVRCNAILPIQPPQERAPAPCWAAEWRQERRFLAGWRAPASAQALGALAFPELPERRAGGWKRLQLPAAHSAVRLLWRCHSAASASCCLHTAAVSWQRCTVAAHLDRLQQAALGSLAFRTMPEAAGARACAGCRRTPEAVARAVDCEQGAGLLSGAVLRDNLARSVRRHPRRPATHRPGCRWPLRSGQPQDSDTHAQAAASSWASVPQVRGLRLCLRAHGPLGGAGQERGRTCRPEGGRCSPEPPSRCQGLSVRRSGPGRAAGGCSRGGAAWRAACCRCGSAPSPSVSAGSAGSSSTPAQQGAAPPCALQQGSCHRAAACRARVSARAGCWAEAGSGPRTPACLRGAPARPGSRHCRRSQVCRAARAGGPPAGSAGRAGRRRPCRCSPARASAWPRAQT